MVFTGEYEHSIDSKNRLAIPSEVRSRIQGSTPGGKKSGLRFYVTLGEGQSLCLYTEQGFQEQADALRNSDSDPDEILAFEAFWFSLARLVEVDAAGRVRLPESLLKRAGLGASVVLLGMNDHLEIRDRDTWTTYVDQMLANQRQHLMNPRRARRRRSGQDT